MAFIVCAVAIVSVANLYEAPDVKLNINQEGEGTIDPYAPGTYDVENHTYITLAMKPADGYDLSAVTVNGNAVTPLAGALTLYIIGNTTIDVVFKPIVRETMDNGSATIGDVSGQTVVVTGTTAGTVPVDIVMQFDQSVGDTISNTKLSVTTSDTSSVSGFVIDGSSTVLDINLYDENNNPVDASDLGGNVTITITVEGAYSDPAVYYKGEGSKTPVPMEIIDSSINGTETTITFVTTHFSEYIVTGSAFQAQVGDTFYLDAAKAFKDATDGSTVILLGDGVISNNAFYNAAITVEGNDNTLTFNGTNFPLANNIVFKNVKFEVDSDSNLFHIVGAVDATFEGCSFEQIDASAGTLNYIQAGTGTSATYSGKLLVNDCVFDNTNETTNRAIRVIAAEGADITVTGSKFITCEDFHLDTSYPVKLTWTTSDAPKHSITGNNIVIGEKAYAIDAYNFGNFIALWAVYSEETLQDAIGAVTNGGTVYIHKNFKATDAISITKAMILEGNGMTIESSASRVFNVGGNGNITIKNLTIDGSGERGINVMNDEEEIDQDPINLVLDKVNVTAANYALNITTNAGAAQVSITNSIFNGLCTINVWGAGSKVTIDNSTVNCNDNTTVEAYAALCINKTATGASIIATNSVINVAEGSDSFKGRTTVVNGTITINGSSDGVAEVVAVINDGLPYYYGYFSLKDAVDAAVDGDVITLVRDSSGPGMTIDKSITIDFGGTTDFAGFTYTAMAPGAGSTGTETQAFQILKGNTVIFKNGTIDCDNSVVTEGKTIKMIIQNYADLTLENMTLDGRNLDYGTVGGAVADYYTLSINSGNVLIKESKIVAHADTELRKGVAFDVYDYSSAGYSLPVVTVDKVTTIDGGIESKSSVDNGDSITYYAEVVSSMKT